MQHRKPRFQQVSEMMSAAEADPSAAPGAFRVGAELRAARLRLGWTLPDVADALRIRLAYLEAIETGRLAGLPGNAYAIGYLRAYANALGLDPAEIARRFRAEAQGVDRRPDLTFPAPAPERGVPVGVVVMLGVVITAISYAAWFGLYDERGAQQRTAPSTPAPLEASKPVPPAVSPQPSAANPPAANPSAASPASPAQPAPPPIPAPPASPAAPPGAMAASLSPDPSAAASQTVLRFTADAWVQVRQKQGTVLVSRVMRPGETWPVPPDGPLLLTTGNAGGTEIVVAGVAQPPLGPPGAVKRDIPLDPQASTPPLSPR